MEFDAFKVATTPQGYECFGSGERHGSYEWTWSRKYYGGLTRFIVVTLTPPLEPPPLQCRLEVWMGAHGDDERFGRYLVAQWDGVDPKKSDEEPLKKKLSSAVAEAAARANLLVLGDLSSLGVTTQLAKEAGEETKVSGAGEPPKS